MADRVPPKELLDNLDLLMSMEVLKAEKDWDLVRDLNDLPPGRMLEQKQQATPPAPEAENGK